MPSVFELQSRAKVKLAGERGRGAGRGRGEVREVMGPMVHGIVAIERTLALIQGEEGPLEV